VISDTALKSSQRLKINRNFTPCPSVPGDELYPNGIFVFNITKMLDYIKENPDEIVLEEIFISDFPKIFSSINESHLNSVEIAKPVILAEIAPGRYNVIDGNHRIEKARMLGVKAIMAYKFNVHQHIQFLISKEAYLSYVEYWNDKIKIYGPGYH